MPDGLCKAASDGPSGRGGPVVVVPRIGREASDHRDGLLLLAGQLASALPDDRAGAAIETADAVRRRAFRIVATGLDGAGRGRVLSLLAGLPGLLPPERPAKTTFLTTLSLGRLAREGAEADIRFFAATELDRLASRAAEATAALPGSRRADPETLRRDVEELRSRAFIRLGESYRELIGTARSIGRIDPDALAPYLGRSEAGRLPDAGRFADITRSVTIHAGAAAFHCPVDLVDAPGFDDGFLPRSAVTAGALAEADLVLAVLGADAPLSAEGRRLLSILAAGHRDRLVVVLNRGEREAGRVSHAHLASAVRDHCARETGGMEVPVVLVAAREAETALLDAAGAGGHPGAALPDLAEAVGQALFFGPAMRCHGEAAGILEHVAREEIARLERRRAALSRRGPGPEGVAAEAARLEAIEARLEDRCRVAGSEIESALSGLWARLRTGCARVLRSAAESDAAARGAQGQPPESDESAADLDRAFVGRLRRALTGKIRADSEPVDDALARLRADIAALLAEAGSDAPEIVVERAETLSSASLAGDIGQTVSRLDDVPLLPPLRDRRGPLRDPQRRIAEMQRRMMLCFAPLTEPIVEAATLVIGESARSRIAMIRNAAREEFARLADAVATDDAPDRLDASADACREAADRLARFRAVCGF